jgi:hypothetical protein
MVNAIPQPWNATARPMLCFLEITSGASPEKFSLLRIKTLQNLQHAQSTLPRLQRQQANGGASSSPNQQPESASLTNINSQVGW